MLRLAERRPHAPADRASGELVDRTGIIAASVPRRADDAVAAETSCESTQQIPVVAGTAPAEQGPRAVVVRRRAQRWIGGGAAVLLVGFGWLTGGLLAGAHDHTSDEVAQADQRVPVAEQQIPVPSTVVAPITQTAPPVTVYVPVPSHDSPARRHVPTRSATPRAPAAPAAEEADPRVDPPAPTTSSAQPRIGQYLDWKSWVDAAERIAAGH
ncbi:hypothetical protein [Amycolatopsis benzoatilytica]|uniref:hypothetical protein n=1 Tax=Amycolatopsis benzoatilytica TaxID=346045 RepID=UPI00035C3629|nr:hypothetical protein [Amycolatopsis benzoatilytica]